MPRQIFVQKNSWLSGARARGSLLGVLQHAVEIAFELSRFGLGEAAQKAVGHTHGYLTHAWVRRTSLFGQLEIHEPAVLRAARAADEPFGLETIEHSRHRPRIVRDDF